MMNALNSARDWSLCVRVVILTSEEEEEEKEEETGEKRADGNAGKRRGVRAVMAFRGHSPLLSSSPHTYTIHKRKKRKGKKRTRY